MLAGVDFRNIGAAVGGHIMERGRRDDAYRILKRSQYMKRKPKSVRRHSLGHGTAYRGYETGALAIGDLFLCGFRVYVGSRCLTAPGLYRASGQTGHCGATL